jgi:hypothetical protein
MGARRGAYRVLVGKPKRKRPLEKLGRRCKNYNNMDLREVKCGAWTGLM